MQDVEKFDPDDEIPVGKSNFDVIFIDDEAENSVKRYEEGEETDSHKMQNVEKFDPDDAQQKPVEKWEEDSDFDVIYIDDEAENPGVKYEEEDTDSDVICIDDEAENLDEEFQEEETDSDVIYIDDEDEDEAQSTSKSAAEIKYRRCAYCYEIVDQREAVQSPRNIFVRRAWAEALGEQYQNYTIRYAKQPTVCRKHFYPTDFLNNGKKILAASVPHRDEMYEGRVLKFSRKFHHIRNGPSQFHYCSYCHARGPRNNFRTLPSSLVTQELWFRKLGQLFRKNAEGKASALICKTHFSSSAVLSNGSHSQYELPLTLEESDRISRNGNNQITKCEVEVKCVYCYLNGSIDEMVRIPEDPLAFQAWANILGARFVGDLKKIPSRYICSSHFNHLIDPAVPEVDERIQVAEAKDSRRKADAKVIVSACVYCGEASPLKLMARVPLDEYQLNKWSDVLGSDFEYNVFKKHISWICKAHFDPDFIWPSGRMKDMAVPFPDECLKNFEKTNEEEIPATLKCTFCNKTNRIREMRKVVKAGAQRDVWVKILGKEFEENCINSACPAICRSHFQNGRLLRSGAHRYGALPRVDVEKEEPDDLLDAAIQDSVKLILEKNHPPSLNNNNFENKNDGVPRSIQSQNRLFFDRHEVLEQPIMKQRRFTISEIGNMKHEEELKNMYNFGWPTIENMETHQKNANRRVDTISDLKCLYCGKHCSSGGEFFVFAQGSNPKQYRKYVEVFGKQFGIQIRSLCDSVMSGELPDPSMKEYKWRLCTRHIAWKNRPIPDMQRHYSMDELADHHYADFSKSFF